MVLPRYLAQTREEFAVCPSLPEHPAWMACHFSPYGTGLVNLPPDLPQGSMVLLNDRIPMACHDPRTIRDQLHALHPEYLLLDFQSAPTQETRGLVRLLVESLSCPTAIPAAYDTGFSCPLFLPLPPPDTSLADHLVHWHDREIWLEIGLGSMTYTVTEQGAVPSSLMTVPECGLRDDSLFCHYRIDIRDEQAVFQLWRTRQDLDALLENAAAFGVTKAIGLWQELK